MLVLFPSQVEDYSKGKHMGDDRQSKSYSVPASIATHTQKIGIIHPPPDIRDIVNKTASYVAKYGPGLEKKIIAENTGKPILSFLKGSDPYHAYYQHRLSEFRAQNQAPGHQLSQSSDAPDPKSTPSAASADGNEATEKTDPSAMFRPVRKVLDPPESEQYTIRLPEDVTGEELDIIKLTAQFVAQNENSFLTGLTSRENNNPQFHFLKPTHSMYMLFTSLVDAYSKVLKPPKGLTDKLKKSVTDMTTVLERCLHRSEWDRSQEQARQKEKDEIEQENVLMSMIDWHDFIVVETIDFADDEDDNLPPPVTLKEVIRRNKMSVSVEEETMEFGEVVEMEMDEEEVQLVQEGMRTATLEKNNDVDANMEVNEPQMRIVKNYKRPEERLAAAAERNLTNTVVSPITGEWIPINEMSEHMRISLIDPKYKEQKDRMFAKIRETTVAQDDEISRNIVGLARSRPDIFGTTEEEVSNAVKAEIKKKNDEQQQKHPEQVIWDGHTATHALSQIASEDQIQGWNLPGPAAPPPRPGVPSLCPLPPPPGLALNLPCVPPNAQYSTVTPPPRPGVSMIVTPLCPPQPIQMNYSHQQPYLTNQPPLLMGQYMNVNPLNIPVPPPSGYQFTHLAPRVFMPQHDMLFVPPPPPPEEAFPPLPEEPEPKKRRLDDSLLVPEDQFLAQHPGPVRVSVSVPNIDEGNLKGKMLEIRVDSLSESVSSLKEKIAADIQLPANKQKLSGKAGFFKDNLSLAYYNVGDGEMLSLSLRERGGRKR